MRSSYTKYLSERFAYYFPLLALAVVSVFAAGVSWEAFAVAYFAVVCVGDAYVHRMLCHDSYHMVAPLRRIHEVLGGIWGSGTPAYWAAGHKPHHLHMNTDKDTFYWKKDVVDFVKHCAAADVDKEEYRRVVKSNKVLSFLASHYLLIQVAVVSSLYAVGGAYAVATFWGMPLIAVYFVTIAAGVASHWDNKPENSFRAWFWTATTTGFHENHHRKPKAYDTGSGRFRWLDIPARYLDVLTVLKLGHPK